VVVNTCVSQEATPLLVAVERHNIADYTMANPNFRAVVADKVSARVRIGTISPRYESSTKVMLQY